APPARLQRWRTDGHIRGRAALRVARGYRGRAHLPGAASGRGEARRCWRGRGAGSVEVGAGAGRPGRVRRGGEESNTGSDERLRFKTQFRKSQLCRYYKTGCMRGDQCDFAHGTEELSLAPDLTKTSMCKAWQRGRCSLDSGACPYAHGASELRCTTGYLKSAPCSMFFQGRCKLGNSCRHAHSLAEIRSAQAFLTSKKSRAVAPAALAPRPAAVAAAMVEARAPGQLSGAVLGFPPPRGALDGRLPVVHRFAGRSMLRHRLRRVSVRRQVTYGKFGEPRHVPALRSLASSRLLESARTSDILC
ncbi:unnamed protein product, partial [Prorocentrum cordatum]